MFSRYWALSVLGSRLWRFRSRDVISHVTIRFPIGHFLFASSHFFGKTHRLVTIHTLQTTDGHNTVAWARSLVRRAKKRVTLQYALQNRLMGLSVLCAAQRMVIFTDSDRHLMLTWHPCIQISLTFSTVANQRRAPPRRDRDHGKYVTDQSLHSTC